MRLLKRKQESERQVCPRCAQLVAEDEGSVCPMCGWDLHDAYQGPPAEAEPAGARAGGRGAAT
jgi:predicted amidophosphoribosyltransferase